MMMPILGANNYTYANNLWEHSTEIDVNQSHSISNSQYKKAERNRIILETVHSK